MNRITLAGLLLAGLFAAPPASAAIIYAEASGSSNPTTITATPTNSLTNGDFIITQDPSSCCSTLLGDGNNDDTAWTFDFGSSANVMAGETLASAMLTLALQTTAGVVSDTIEIVGLGARAASEIRGLPGGFDGSITFDLLPYYSSLAILAELANPTTGQLSMIYEDDAIVSYARLTLATAVPEPASLALICIGLAGLGYQRQGSGLAS